MSKNIRNLMLVGGPYHPADANAPSLTRQLAERGVTSDIEQDIEAGCDRLAKGNYPLLTVAALRWRMREPKYDALRTQWALDLSEPAREAIRTHLRSGGALLAMHTASICFDGWPQWGEIVGGRWVWGQSGHDPFGDVEVQFDAAPPGSIAAGLASFECRDEVYERQWLAPGVQPLAHARNRVSASGQPGAWAPVLWTHSWEGGRVVYDALGHDAQSLDHPVHQQLLARAIDWLVADHQTGS